MFTAGPSLLVPASTAPAYSISNSIRFRSSASAYLSRTPGSASNRKTWTWSGWVKRGTLGTSYSLFTTNSNSNPDYSWLAFTGSDILQFNAVQSTLTNRIVAYTTSVFRDPAAHYHVVLSVDTTQATNSNGVRLWVNGVQQTLTFSTYTQNYDTAVNSTLTHYIGQWNTSSYFDGYMSEINFIDGQALTPSSFGKTNSTGVWVPKAYTGTYGTNGFYLKFNNATSTSTLGNDSSGNSNNWTVNNVSLTAGATYDWMTDTPTNNYWTLTPLDPNNCTISYANLRASGASDNASNCVAPTMPPSGKWYWEAIITAVGAEMSLGLYPSGTVCGTTANGFYVVGQATNSVGYYSTGSKIISGSMTAYGASYTTGDVIGVAYDADNNQITFYKNNSSQGTITGLTNGPYKPAFECRVAGGTSDTAVNFGQRPFSYSPPSGFKALSTSNL